MENIGSGWTSRTKVSCIRSEGGWIFVAGVAGSQHSRAVFSGAFNARYGAVPNSKFHLSNMEIAFRVNTGGYLEQHSIRCNARLHSRNTNITLDGKHAYPRTVGWFSAERVPKMRSGASCCLEEDRALYSRRRYTCRTPVRERIHYKVLSSRETCYGCNYAKFSAWINSSATPQMKSGTPSYILHNCVTIGSSGSGGFSGKVAHRYSVIHSGENIAEHGSEHWLLSKV